MSAIWCARKGSHSTASATCTWSSPTTTTCSSSIGPAASSWASADWARRAASSTCRPACGPTISTACSSPTCSTAAWCCSSIWAEEPTVSSKARLLFITGMLLAFPSVVVADRIADIRNTKHNLSATGPGTLKATTETQVCVFCHTPHGATQGVTPLWNRQLSNQTYTTYTSSSLDANAIQGSLDQPGGSSKLCLSCHDGTL